MDDSGESERGRERLRMYPDQLTHRHRRDRTTLKHTTCAQINSPQGAHEAHTQQHAQYRVERVTGSAAWSQLVFSKRRGVDQCLDSVVHLGSPFWMWTAMGGKFMWQVKRLL